MDLRDFHPDASTKGEEKDVPAKPDRGVLGRPLVVRTREIHARFRLNVKVIVSEPPVADDDLVVASLTQHITKSIANHRNLMIGGIEIIDLRAPEPEPDEDPAPLHLEQGSTEEPEVVEVTLDDIVDVDPDEEWPLDE